MSSIYRRVPHDPPEYIKPATPVWYDWYLNHPSIPGNAWFLKVGLQLAPQLSTRLESEINTALEKEIEQKSIGRLRLFRYSPLVVELVERWRPRINVTVPGVPWRWNFSVKANLMV